MKKSPIKPHVWSGPHKQKVLAVHDTDRLEAILKETGNNCGDMLIKVGRREADDYVSCLQNILEYTAYDPDKHHLVGSDIFETEKDFQVRLAWFSNRESGYAAFALDDLPHRSVIVKIPKQPPSEDDVRSDLGCSN